MRKNIRRSISNSLALLALASVAAAPALAQGSRKDDIAFALSGRPIPGATITICTAGATGTPCSPLATLYTDATLTTTAANPLTADGLGNYHFYAAPGRYVVQISGSGVTTYTMSDVILPSDPFYVALKRTANEGVCYASPDGSDANDGRSYGTAKATILGNATQNGCWQALPSGGGTIYVSGTLIGSTAYGPSVGGTVTGQGLWIAGAVDPNYSSLPAGWVQAKKVQVIGVSGAATTTNAFQQAVTLCAGSSTDSTKPALWLSGVNNSPLGFYNITFASLNTSGVCTGLNFPGTVIRVGIDSNNNRNTNSTVASLTLDNVQVPEQANATPGGAVIDIGSNSFFLFFRRIVCAGDTIATSHTADASACILVNPGTGSSTSLAVEDSIVSNGGIKYYKGTTSSSLIVDNLETENMNSVPAVWIASSNSSTQVSVRNVRNSDATASSIFENDGSALPVLEGLITGGGAGSTSAIVGPATVPSVTGAPFSTETASPESKGQVGFFANRVIGQQDTFRRSFGLVNARISTALNGSQTQLPSTWNTVANLTITTGIAAPDGSTNAGQLTCSSGTCSPNPVQSPAVNVSAGDFFVAGVWARSVTANGFNGGSPFLLNVSGNTCNGGTSSVNPVPWINGDGGNWEFYWALCKVGSTQASAAGALAVQVDTSHTVQYFAPVILYLPASSYTADEAYDIAEHLASFPDNATLGDATPLRGHPLAFGASSNNFFGRLVHSNTANRTYTFPDGTGNVMVTGSGTFAQQITYDNFTRANGAIGSNWTVTTGGLNVTSNTIQGTTASADNAAFWNQNSFGADQFSEVTITALNGTTDFPGPAVRVSTGNNLYSCIENTTTFFLRKVVAGTATNITTTSTTGAVGDVIRAEVKGSTITCYKNGTSITTTTDTALTSGSPGLDMFGNVATAKNWLGGNLVPLAQLNIEADWTQPQHFLNGFSLNTNGFQGTFTGAPLTANQSYTMPNQTGTLALAAAATTASLGGSSLAAGACTSNTTSVTGATTSMAVAASPSADPGAPFTWMAFVSSANTVTTRVCNFTSAAATPTATAYNLRVLQ